MPNDRPMNRPIRSQQITRLGFARRPPDEPLTPGLRRQQPANAIGFTASIVTPQQADVFVDRYMKRD